MHKYSYNDVIHAIQSIAFDICICIESSTQIHSNRLFTTSYQYFNRLWNRKKKWLIHLGEPIKTKMIEYHKRQCRHCWCAHSDQYVCMSTYAARIHVCTHIVATAIHIRLHCHTLNFLIVCQHCVHDIFSLFLCILIICVYVFTPWYEAEREENNNDDNNIQQKFRCHRRLHIRSRRVLVLITHST